MINTSLTKNAHFLLLYVIEKCVTIKIKCLQLYFDLKWEFMFSYSWCWINNTKGLRARLRKNLFGSILPQGDCCYIVQIIHFILVFSKEKVVQNYGKVTTCNQVFCTTMTNCTCLFVRSLFLLMINFQINKEVGKVSSYLYFIPPVQPIVEHNTVSAM